MAELGFSPVTLPSHGVLYGDSIPGGVVQIRKMTTREESILLQQGSQGLERIDAILNACVKLPNAYEHSNLLMQDRMALLLALRTITFGPNYTIPFKCQHCGAMNKKGVNIIEDLDQKTAAEDLSEPISVSLPDNGSVLSLRFLRGVDEERIAKRSKRLNMQSNDPGDPSHIHRLALQIVSVDGNESMSLPERESFVRSLTAADSAAMRIAVDAVEPGIDLTVFLDCRNCGTTNELVLPFTAEFFRPTAL